jgi:hypothetical protein
VGFEEDEEEVQQKGGLDKGKPKGGLEGEMIEIPLLLLIIYIILLTRRRLSVRIKVRMV